MGELIDDDVLNAFAVVAPPDKVAAELRNRFEGMSTASASTPLQGGPRGVEGRAGRAALGAAVGRRACDSRLEVRCTRPSRHSTATRRTRTATSRWGAPDPEVFTFINDLERDIGTFLYWTQDVRDDGLLGDLRRGRRPAGPPAGTSPDSGGPPSKVVYSRTLDVPSSARTPDRTGVRSRRGAAHEADRRDTTSPLAARIWRARRWPHGVGRRAAPCSSHPSRSGAAHPRSPPTSVPTWRWWTSTASRAAPSTWSTASVAEAPIRLRVGRVRRRR